MNGMCIRCIFRLVVIVLIIVAILLAVFIPLYRFFLLLLAVFTTVGICIWKGWRKIDKKNNPWMLSLKLLSSISVIVTILAFLFQYYPSISIEGAVNKVNQNKIILTIKNNSNSVSKFVRVYYILIADNHGNDSEDPVTFNNSFYIVRSISKEYFKFSPNSEKGFIIDLDGIKLDNNESLTFEKLNGMGHLHIIAYTESKFFILPFLKDFDFQALYHCFTKGELSGKEDGYWILQRKLHVPYKKYFKDMERFFKKGKLPPMLKNYKELSCFAYGKTEIVWQQSEANSVQLGIRDKYGDLKSYKALFVVKDASGKEYKAEKDILDDAWAYVYFPNDFKVYGSTGDYTWEGIVNGKVVASGKFRLNMINE